MSSLRLAEELASRLSTIVPSGYSVRAEGPSVRVSSGNVQLGGSSAALIVDEKDNRSSDQKIENAIRSVLSRIQDCVMQALTEPWPQTQNGQIALPGARSDGKSVFLWYGVEDDPDVLLSPINIEEMGKPD